jgi:hypothetical protein
VRLVSQAMSVSLPRRARRPSAGRPERPLRIAVPTRPVCRARTAAGISTSRARTAGRPTKLVRTVGVLGPSARRTRPAYRAAPFFALRLEPKSTLTAATVLALALS